MTNEEIVQLIQEGKDVQANLGLLYEQNIGMISKITFRLAKTNEEFEDLKQEAFFGLKKATDLYDMEQGVKFITYAIYWIKQTCTRYKFRHATSIRISEDMQHRVYQYRRYYKKYIIEHGEKPTKEITMKEMNLTEPQYNNMMDALMNTNIVSINESITGADEGEDVTLGDTLKSECDVETEVLDEIMKSELWDAVEELDNAECDVIKKRYKENATLDAIAEYRKVSRSRIGAIESKALNHLKHMQSIVNMAEEFGYDCNIAYHRGVGKFQNTNTSATEFLALKHIEMEEKHKNLDDQFNELLSMI